MWTNPLTQSHMSLLLVRGALQVGPGVGRLASGAAGAGRMAEPGEILAAARLALAAGGPLAGRRVLGDCRRHAGTAGPRALHNEFVIR